MKHARDDYNRIQDPAGKIGADEPVFLLRAQDKSAPEVVRFWADENVRNDGELALSELAERWADTMEEWQRANGSKPADLSRGTPPSPSTASEVDELAAFEAWWANQIESNGGASIGADYRHWAEKGFRAALASNPATTTEGAGVWQPIATMPADQFVLCAGELDGPGDWRIKMGTKEGGTGKIRLLGGSWEPKLWTSLPSKPSTPDRAAKPADSEAKV